MSYQEKYLKYKYKYLNLKNSIGGGNKPLIIPEGTTVIGTRQYNSQDFTSVSIPESVTTIDKFAFAFNDITKLEIPKSVTTINEGAFAFNAITELLIPISVTTIGKAAFAYNHLTTIIISRRFKDRINEIFKNDEQKELNITFIEDPQDFRAVVRNALNRAATAQDFVIDVLIYDDHIPPELKIFYKNHVAMVIFNHENPRYVMDWNIEPKDYRNEKYREILNEYKDNNKQKIIDLAIIEFKKKYPLFQPEKTWV